MMLRRRWGGGLLEDTANWHVPRVHIRKKRWNVDLQVSVHVDGGWGPRVLG